MYDVVAGGACFLLLQMFDQTALANFKVEKKNRNRQIIKGCFNSLSLLSTRIILSPPLFHHLSLILHMFHMRSTFTFHWLTSRTPLFFRFQLLSVSTSHLFRTHTDCFDSLSLLSPLFHHLSVIPHMFHTQNQLPRDPHFTIHCLAPRTFSPLFVHIQLLSLIPHTHTE